MKILILSGGASRGAIQLPILERLDLSEYDHIYGTSVGSLNGLMAAQHDLKTLREIWGEIDGVSSFMVFKWWWPFNGIYSLRPLRDLIELHTSLDKIKTTFTAGVISLNDGDYYGLCTRDMSDDRELHDAVQASSTIVGVMEPKNIMIRGVEHLAADGGFRNIIPSPISPREEITEAHILLCTPVKRVRTTAKVNGITQHIMRGIEIMEDEILNRDLYEISLALPNARLKVYAPLRDPLPSFKADKDTIRYRYKIGVEAWENPIIM